MIKKLLKFMGYPKTPAPEKGETWVLPLVNPFYEDLKVCIEKVEKGWVTYRYLKWSSWPSPSLKIKEFVKEHRKL